MLWFKHQSGATNDAKLKKLIIRHGPVGYAVYFHCLELITGDFDETNITFELEHDSEIIADNLKIMGSADKSGVAIVEEIMRTIIGLELFTESNGHIHCFKLLKNIDTSMTSNTKLRAMIVGAKENHDKIMTHHDGVMQDKTRQDKIKRVTPSADASGGGRSEKEVKHKIGTFMNVLLTARERDSLFTDFGRESSMEAIEYLSEYRERKGYKAKSDYLAIRKWVFDAVKEEKARKTKLQPFSPSLKVHQRTTSLDMEE